MGGRTLPTECKHGRIIDWGDFAPGDRTEPYCPDCASKAHKENPWITHHRSLAESDRIIEAQDWLLAERAWERDDARRWAEVLKRALNNVGDLAAAGIQPTSPPPPVPYLPWEVEA